MIENWNYQKISTVKIVHPHFYSLMKYNFGQKSKWFWPPLVESRNTISWLKLYLLDAVGSWQKILPMPNLERAY